MMSRLAIEKEGKVAPSQNQQQPIVMQGSRPPPMAMPENVTPPAHAEMGDVEMDRENQGIFAVAMMMFHVAQHPMPSTAMLGAEAVHNFIDAPPRDLRWLLRWFRVRGTMTTKVGHSWSDSAARGAHLRTLGAGEPCKSRWLQAVLTGSIAPQLEAPVAAAAHRALTMEWIDGGRVLRSMHTRKHDITVDDVRAADAFFSVVEHFTHMYFASTEAAMGTVFRADREPARTRAIRAMDDFATSRANLRKCCCSRCVTTMLEAGSNARELTIRASFGEATGVGGLDFVDAQQMASHWASKSASARLMVLVLARGALPCEAERSGWDKLLVPDWDGHASARRLARRMRDHVGIAKAFENAEREYRVIFATRNS